VLTMSEHTTLLVRKTYVKSLKGVDVEEDEGLGEGELGDGDETDDGIGGVNDGGLEVLLAADEIDVGTGREDEGVFRFERVAAQGVGGGWTEVSPLELLFHYLERVGELAVEHDVLDVFA
jgi:hypothetical protein